MKPPVLVLGATGRIGAALRRFWPEGGRLSPIWQSRTQRAGFLKWDILAERCPLRPEGGVVVCLAGGRGGDHAANTALALAALDAAAECGARHVFLASSAAVYAPGEGLSEAAATLPPSPYGAAKLAMEQAARAWLAGRAPPSPVPEEGGRADAPAAPPGLTCLRIGNVAGADALLGRKGDGPAVLDPVPEGARGPVRSYIGPGTLALVLAALAERAAAGGALPSVLNVAAPRPVAMADLLDAAGMPWRFGPPNPAVIPAVTFDTARLQALVTLSPGASEPATMVAEWRALAAAAP